MPSSILLNEASLVVGSWTRQGARPCWLGSSDNFAQTTSIQSRRSGRDSVTSSSGIATNGENAFPNTPTVFTPAVNGRLITCSDAVGGSGSFPCREATSVQALFMTIVFSSFQKDQAWVNGCMRTFSAIL